MYLDNCLVRTWSERGRDVVRWWSERGRDVVRWWSERGRDVVRWWSERGRDVYLSGKTRPCHVPNTGHCQYDMF